MCPRGHGLGLEAPRGQKNGGLGLDNKVLGLCLCPKSLDLVLALR